MSDTSTRRLMRLETAADAADCSRATIYRAIKDGNLTLVKLGRASMIPVESFDAWIAGLPRTTLKVSA